MVQVQPTVHRPLPQSLLVAALLLASPTLAADRFYADDPIRAVPPPLPVSVDPRNTDALYDFIRQSFQPQRRPASPSLGVNTLGEVPDSEWFTNRHGARRLTREELKRGPGDATPPQPPFRVSGGKIDGITPGFRIIDGKGTLYFVKPDPRSNPEMATAADVIGARFFFAIGYNTPRNYILNVHPDALEIGAEARVKGLDDKRRPMNRRDLNDILRNVPRQPDGAVRLIASEALPGKPLGSFRYEKTRPDDPNDTIPHDRRRDLRGLHVFAAWLNHTDAKAGNTLDVLVERDGRAFVRHYLIDFGAALGSDSDMPKNARFGHEFIIPGGRDALARMAAFGFDVRPWERADFGSLKSVGRLESSVFDPELWKSNYPNPAFLSRNPGDEFWAARIVMAFSDDDIRAIVETGQYSDPQAVEYITRALIERRDKIGRAYFARVLPLDSFRVEQNELRFDDLAVRHGYSTPRSFTISWARFHNSTGQSSPLLSQGPQLPAEVLGAMPGDYFSATLSTANQPGHRVDVFLRRTASGFEVAGVDRTW